jgi:hypothetical protein
MEILNRYFLHICSKGLVPDTVSVWNYTNFLVFLSNLKFQNSRTLTTNYYIYTKV